MRCITLTQPWASLIAIGAKQNETRSWALPINYGNALMGIHASKGLGPVGGKEGYIAFCTEHERVYAVLHNAGLVPFSWDANALLALPFGALVATVQWSDCVRIQSMELLPDNLTRLVRGFSTWRGEPVTYLVTADEFDFGIYEIGRYVWVSRSVQRFAPVIPAKGAQRLWKYYGQLPTTT